MARPEEEGTGIVRTATMEVIVAALFFAFGAVVMFDSYRIGASWASDGPESGYFPFYTGLIICVAALVLLIQGMRKRLQFSAAFVEAGPFRQVVLVFLPALLYVGGIALAGIYVASAIYIALFMKFLGHYTWLRSVTVGLSVGLFAFVLFERWFHIPLPKGFLERALGY
jgi:putative tricarboxylic transport membrane protein